MRRNAQLDAAAVRTSTMLLGGLTAIEAGIVLEFHDVFLPPLRAHLDRIPPLAWLFAVVVAVAYVLYSIRGLPVISTYFWNVSAFKVLGLCIAIPAAILEEVFFRGYVMNVLSSSPVVMQVVASALSFGIAHVVWGFRGGARAMVGAVGSTTLMGAALALVYLASNRAILPCVLGHFLITFALEPWLIYAYVARAEGGPSPRAA